MKRSRIGSISARARGFTLVELILVIIVLGILGAIAVPRLPDVGLFNRQFDVRQVVSSLSRARAHAVASQCHVLVRETDGALDARIANDCVNLEWDDTRNFLPGGGGNVLGFIAGGLSGRSPGFTGTPPVIVFTPSGEARRFTGSDLTSVNVLSTGSDLTYFSGSSGTLSITHSSGRSILIDDTTGYARWQ